MKPIQLSLLCEQWSIDTDHTSAVLSGWLAVRHTSFFCVLGLAMALVAATLEYLSIMSTRWVEKYVIQHIVTEAPWSP